MCDQQSLRSACAYAQSDQSLFSSLEPSMNVKLLSEHHLEFLSLNGDYRGSSECTHVKMSHCWKYYALAHFIRVQTISFADADSIRTNIGQSPLTPLRLAMGSITKRSICLITGIRLALVQSSKIFANI